jgi:hypothetical protein
MTSRALIFLLLLSLNACLAAAGEIREFDVKTLEGLGREIDRVSHLADKGATNEVRKRARQTAIGALKGRLFKVHYEYLVIDDPGGSGFLVYALVTTGKPGQFYLGGHFRVTVSADGAKAERVDALSHSLLPPEKPPKGSEGAKPEFVTMSQVVSDIPIETCVYFSLSEKIPVSVSTMDGQWWIINKGNIVRMTPELIRSLGLEDKKKK